METFLCILLCSLVTHEIATIILTVQIKKLMTSHCPLAKG